MNKENIMYTYFCIDTYTHDTLKIYKEGIPVFYSILDESGGVYIRSGTTNNYCIILFKCETPQKLISWKKGGE